MKTDLEREEIMIKAEMEILEILKRHGLTMNAENMIIFINHIEDYDNGDMSVRSRSVAC